jgi:hypothetical protein
LEGGTPDPFRSEWDRKVRKRSCSLGFESCVPAYGGESYADFSEDFESERFLSIAEKSSFI